MIRKIRSSLTIKFCILIAILLMVASGITYAVILQFLPTYYRNQLEEDIAAVSRDIAEKICSYKAIEDAFYAVELFEAGSQVSVTILDEQGNQVYPLVETAVVEDVMISGDAVEDVYSGGIAMEYDDNVGRIADEKDAEYSFIVEEERRENITAEQILQDSFESNNSAIKYYDLEVDGNVYTMIVSGGMQPVNQAMEIMRRIFPYILGVSIVIAIIFSSAVSLYLTAPIVRLSRTSKKMAALDFVDRYQGKRTDEIGILGSNLNELSANLSSALQELQQTNAKLQSDIELEREIEKKRITFFSAVSHELKTPITILKGHLSGMLQGIGEYQNRDYYLQRSVDTAEKMENMVGELLTVSRIESKKFTMQKTDLAEQLRQQLADLAELMEEKNLELQVDMPEHLEAEVNPTMMEKVFRNLLINAVRYTPDGAGNQIRVFLYSESEEAGKIICRVENTGVFIPEEALPHLFEAFYRVEQSRNRQTGGSGLGLYIVKMVLEQHQAEYGIHNTENGVEFFFSL